jgi:hypothetical protein
MESLRGAGEAMQREDCGRTRKAGESEGWVVVRLESTRGIEILTYCEHCAKQFESDDVSPIAGS